MAAWNKMILVNILIKISKDKYSELSGRRGFGKEMNHNIFS
jgi:hypothetical protein